MTVFTCLVHDLEAVLRWLDMASRISGFEMEGRNAYLLFA